MGFFQNAGVPAGNNNRGNPFGKRMWNRFGTRSNMRQRMRLIRKNRKKFKHHLG